MRTEWSEDAATGETEGGRAEPWAAYRLAPTILVDLANAGPHTTQAGRDGAADKSWLSLNFLPETPVVGGFCAFEEIVI